MGYAGNLCCKAAKVSLLWKITKITMSTAIQSLNRRIKCSIFHSYMKLPDGSSL